MIQELTDCGPSRTYPVYYLEDAMNNLGDCFDYAVNDCEAEGSEVAELFRLSGVAREFERGNAWVVSGKSGVELFALIAERSGYQTRSMPDRTYRFEKTPEYWTGWILAFLQWRLGESFEDLLHVVPYDVLRNLYYPWHEASVTTVRAIAKAIHCNIEDLLEPAFNYKEPSAA